MHKSYLSAILTVTALSFSEQLLAKGLTDRDYQIAKKNISDEARAAKKNCELLINKEKDICLVNVKKNEKVAKNKLNARYKKINHLDNKMSTSNTEQESTQRHSTLKIDHLRRP